MEIYSCLSPSSLLTTLAPVASHIQFKTLAYRAVTAAITQRTPWSLVSVKTLLRGGMSSPLESEQQSHCPSPAAGVKHTFF